MHERIANTIILCPFEFFSEIVTPFGFPPATTERRFRERTGYSKSEWQVREEDRKLRRQLAALIYAHNCAVESLLHDMVEQDRQHQREIQELEKRYRKRYSTW